MIESFLQTLWTWNKSCQHDNFLQNSLTLTFLTNSFNKYQVWNYNIESSAHSYPTYKMTCWWNTNKWNLKLFIELWINVGRQHAKDVFFLERRRERGIKYFVRKLMHWLDKFEQIVTFPLIHFDFWTKQNFILASFANQLKLLISLAIHFEMTSYIFVDYILDYYCKVGT